MFWPSALCNLVQYLVHYFIWLHWSRYELQKDQSLIGEEEFVYDYTWFKSRIQGCLEFWKGEREANFTPVEERWKCRYCQFSSVCPANFKPESTRSSSQTDSYSTPS